jgi:translation initiation factor 5B
MSNISEEKKRKNEPATKASLNSKEFKVPKSLKELQTQLRTPCCAVLGHVDVGKTKLLDYMRHTSTEEASGITQQIGTTLYNKDRLEKLIGPNLKTKFNIDSLLMIDTPGHECFDTIRNVAIMITDVVILIIDMIKGIEKQTIHVISLLKKYLWMG